MIMTLLDFMIRILTAMLLGLFIGLERQLTGHIAGIRINVLVSLGACVFVLFSTLVNAPDLTRIAAQIVTGVGFLCSGIIVKDGVNIRGLNTAATIWCTAAIGVLSSSGKIVYASAATLLLLLVNVIFRFIVQRIFPMGSFDDHEQYYKISLVCREEKEFIIRAMLMRPAKRFTITNLESDDVDTDFVQINALFSTSGRRLDQYAEQLVERISLEDGVKKVGWELVG